jgi:O-antigen ligase
VDGYPSTYLQFLLPVVTLLILVKPPSLADGKVAADVLSWGLVATVLIAEAQAALYGRPPHVMIPVRWGFISDVFGITERWYGPFLYPSFAGMAGCFLAVYGLTRRRLPGIVFMLVGGVVVVVSGQNTAVLAAVVGALTIFVFSEFPRRLGVGLGRRLAIVGVILAVLGGYALWQNPTLSLRTPLYPIFLDFWRSSPLTGIGYSGIAAGVAAGRVPQSLTSSHNISIDLLARFGLVGFVLGTGILVSAIWATVGPARRGVSAGLVLVVTFLTIGLAENPTDWLNWSIPTIYLLLGVLLAADRPPRHPGQEAGSPASSS